MKLIFVLFLYFPLFYTSSHKSHQNESVQYVRYHPVKYSPNLGHSELSAFQIPRFISNNNDRLYNPLQIPKMMKMKANYNNAPKFRINNANRPSQTDYEMPESMGTDSLGQGLDSFTGKSRNKAVESFDNDEDNLSQEPEDNQKPNSKSKKKSAKIPEDAEKDESDCNCGAVPKCSPCGYGTPGAGACRCASPPELLCPSCNVGKAIRQIHEAAQKEVR